jgi:hypothetical protein
LGALTRASRFSHAAASLRLRQRRTAPVAALGAVALSPDVLFGVANAVVMPVYGLMLWSPRSQLARRPPRARFGGTAA